MGVPRFERFWLGHSLKFASSFATPGRAIRSIESVGRKLISVAEHAGAEDAFHPTSVPRLIGIDSRSTAWSVVMVIEHLASFNADVLKIIRSLQQELPPRGAIQMADYDPDRNGTWESVDDFRQSVNELSWLISGDAPLTSNAMFLHPWYGSLTAHQWLCCVALHQYAHLRHVRKIVAVLGVT
jgi:hypothetical protein